MFLNCTSCSTLLSVHDSAFNKGIPSITCPICNTVFKPDVETVNRLLLEKIDALPPMPEPEKEADKEPEKEFGTTENSEIGWLVVHDESTPSQTFPLKLGRNLVGRKSKERPCDIMIETRDEYMSRNHFVLQVMKSQNGTVQYILADNNAKNHTYINTNRLRQISSDDEFILSDGDIIQAGQTKIVFKSNREIGSAAEASNHVKEKPIGKTVFINM